MNIFDTIEIEKNGRIWKLHPFRRYDPITASLAVAGAGTAVNVAGTLKQGKQEQQIAERRAEIDIENAEAVRESAVERATIERERGQRILATQKSQAAASGIRINVGAPLVIAAETRANIARDIGFGLEAGRVEEGQFRSSAALEIAGGKAAKKASRFSALTQGLTGAANIGFMGSEAGLFGKTRKKKKVVSSPSPGAAGFGSTPSHLGTFFA